MLGLELLEPFDQPVVLAVADLGGRLDVVLPVVAADFLAEPGNFGGRVGHWWLVVSCQLSVVSGQGSVASGWCPRLTA